MKIDIKQIFNPLKPDWRRIVLFIILFLVMPQKISNNFVLFGGVYIIKSLFEEHPPDLDLMLTIIFLVAFYFLACLLIWVYDKKVNKFIVSEGEVEVQPPEKEEKVEQKVGEAPKEASNEENK